MIRKRLTIWSHRTRDDKSADAAERLGGRVSAATKLGTFVNARVSGAPVEYEGSGQLRARSTIALDQPAITLAITTRQPVLLLFENGDPRLPIVVGCAGPRRRQARRARGDNEVTLKCGEASITLRRDG